MGANKAEAEIEICELSEVAEDVRSEILALTAPWYRDSNARPRHGARALMYRGARAGDTIHVALARLRDDELVAWATLVGRDGRHVIANMYVGAAYRHNGLSGTMIEAIKQHADGPVFFKSGDARGDAVAARHGLELHTYGAPR